MLLTAGAGLAAPPQLKEFEVVGKAQAKQVGADKGAEEDALRQAVETAAREIDAKAVEEKLAVFQAKILRQPRRYVEEIRTADRTEAGATVIVKIRAKVKMDLLRADLVKEGILSAAAANPGGTTLTRVVVLPAASKQGAAPWWAAGGQANAPDPLTMVLVDALRAKGFQVQEPRRPEADPSAAVTPPPPPAPDMATANLVSVGKSYNVDLVVRVPWEVTAASRGIDGVVFGLARARLGPVEAIAVKDGSVVATVTGEGVAGEPIDFARAKSPLAPEVATRVNEGALRAAAADAAAKLSAALGDPVGKEGASSTVDLVVAGLDSFVAYARFESVLVGELKSVRAASLKSIERGEAVFRLSLQRGKDAAGVADEIAKKEFAEFNVKVTEKTPERVVVRVSR